MNQNNLAQRLDGEIIPPELAVRAMRDSGYRNTAYALAELIDNSIQANARNIDVICIERKELVNERESRRISAIGVIDNGDGMQSEVLRLALQFGNGTHLKDRVPVLVVLVWDFQILRFLSAAKSRYGHGRMVPITHFILILTWMRSKAGIFFLFPSPDC